MLDLRELKRLANKPLLFLKGVKKMGKLNLTRVFKDAQVLVSRKSPEILTGLGIAGFITTAVLAVKATPKALRLIEAEKRKQNRKLANEAEKNGHDSCEQIKNLTPLETAKTCWKCYVPAVLTGVTSTACIIGASSVSARRTAALATAYKLSETALTEYKDKVVETIGEKKEKLVRDSIDKDKIDRDPISKKEVIVTKAGDTLCYDSLSGRYFKSDIETIKKAVNELNKRMMSDMYISLNEFYDELELSHTAIGYEIGWNIDDRLIEVDFSSQIAEDGTPCIVVGYDTPPKYNYSRLM